VAVNYIVVRVGGYLALEGPFCYPHWVPAIEYATPLSWVRAHAFALAYGGEVRSFPS
jgi:hypothetical protein